MDEKYLGDGLYAAFDGFQLRLRAPRSEGDHVVYLEDWMWVELRKLADGWFQVQK